MFCIRAGRGELEREERGGRRGKKKRKTDHTTDPSVSDSPQEIVLDGAERPVTLSPCSDLYPDISVEIQSRWTSGVHTWYHGGSQMRLRWALPAGVHFQTHYANYRARHFCFPEIRVKNITRSSSVICAPSAGIDTGARGDCRWLLLIVSRFSAMNLARARSATYADDADRHPDLGRAVRPPVHPQFCVEGRPPHL